MLALLLPLRTSRTCPSSAHAVLSLIHSIHAGSRTDAHIYIRAPTYARFTFPLCFPFPSSFFLLVTLQHLSPILVPLSSFVVNESLYLLFFLCVCPMDFFLSLLPGDLPISLSCPPEGCYFHCVLSLSDIYGFSLGTVSPTRSLSIPCWRNFRPLQRQPNKCLSDYLHRHFSATLS